MSLEDRSAESIESIRKNNHHSTIQYIEKGFTNYPAREFFQYYFFISYGECRFSKIGTPVSYVDTLERTLFQSDQ